VDLSTVGTAQLVTIKSASPFILYMRGGNAALPKLLWDLLFHIT